MFADDEREYLDSPVGSLLAERRWLRAVLKMPGEPIFLDIKPGPLTLAERREFEGKLGIVNQAIGDWLS